METCNRPHWPRSCGRESIQQAQSLNTCSLLHLVTATPEPVVEGKWMGSQATGYVVGFCYKLLQESSKLSQEVNGFQADIGGNGESPDTEVP